MALAQLMLYTVIPEGTRRRSIRFRVTILYKGSDTNMQTQNRANSIDTLSIELPREPKQLNSRHLVPLVLERAMKRLSEANKLTEPRYPKRTFRVRSRLMHV
jgi:hypothetical protein